MLNNKKKYKLFKLLLVIILIVIFILIIPSNIFAKVIKLGDINGDEKIDLKDALMMITYISMKENDKSSFFTEDEFLAGDITQDKQINATDLLILLRYIMSPQDRIIESKPEEETKPEDKPVEEIYPERIEIDESITLKEGETSALNVTIYPSNSTNKTITLSSSNTDIVIVNNDGTITGKSAGTATITAQTSNGKVATCNVTINELEIKASNISLDETNLTIEAGKTFKLTATINPIDTTDKAVIWSSSNANIATINNDGTITGKSAGTATITAQTSNGKIATCTVIVKELSDKKISKTLKASDFNKVVSVIPKSSSCKIAQSFCITDKYYICALINSSNSKTMIQVYNKNDGNLVNTLAGNFYHANGMTYNSKNDKIYIAHMSGGTYSTISAGNIATAKSISKTTSSLSRSISSIAYDEYTGNYYAAKGSKIYVFNSSLKCIKSFKKAICNTPQDIGAYRGLILVIDYKSGGNNAIDIYRASTGEYLGRYTIKISGELESVSYDETNKVFALYFNNGTKNAIYTTNSIDLEQYYI